MGNPTVADGVADVVVAGELTLADVMSDTTMPS
jgi:hypothetical protein